MERGPFLVQEQRWIRTEMISTDFKKRTINIQQYCKDEMELNKF